MRAITLLVLLSVINASTIAAQTPGQLQVGARVRLVSLDGKRTTGRLGSLTTDSIALLPSGNAVALQRLSQLQVSGGKRRGRSALIGGAIGLAVGAVGGAIAGAAIYRNEQKECDNVVCILVVNPHIGAAAGAYGGGALGLVSGAIVGALVGRERWISLIGS